jgi:putative heme transporter
VRVDPLLVLIAITLGVQVLGLVGALIAVPVAGMAQVITQRLIAPAIRHASTESVALPAVPMDTSMPVPSSRVPAPADSLVD